MGHIRLGTKAPLTVLPESTVTEASRAMVGRQVGAATVVDGDRILGVVSERDVLKKIVAAGRDPDRTLIREIMTSPAITVGAKTTVPEAAELMRKNHIRHLVVVDDDGRLVGMLALRYLLYDMMNDMQRDVSDLLGYIMMDGPGG